MLLQYITSISEIYGTQDPVIPARYRSVAFTPPRKGQQYLSKAGCVETCYYNSIDSPRIILEPLPRKKRYIFEETGEAPRIIQRGEYGLTPSGDILYFRNAYGCSIHPHTPVTLRTEEF